MKRLKGLFGVALLPVMVACVTINIYFPAAAAEEAADKVIQEVWGTQPGAEEKPVPGPEKGSMGEPDTPDSLGWLLDLAVSPAYAAQAQIDVSTPAIRSIQASMKARHAQLEPYYANGAVGLTRDGLVAVRDASAVPLRERQRVNQLVAEENRDRNALYREIATANGHPEWEQEIRSTFADRWVGNAPSGWWYQTASGSWAKK